MLNHWRARSFSRAVSNACRLYICQRNAQWGVLTSRHFFSIPYVPQNIVVYMYFTIQYKFSISQNTCTKSFQKKRTCRRFAKIRQKVKTSIFRRSSTEQVFNAKRKTLPKVGTLDFMSMAPQIFLPIILWLSCVNADFTNH